jgi:hypothetical protein
MSNGDFTYPARGKLIAEYFTTDGTPPEGYKKVAEFPRLAFQVAKNKPPSSLYRKDASSATDGNASE